MIISIISLKGMLLGKLLKILIHEIRNEWVQGFKSLSGSFLNFTNNQLESTNAKLKQAISRNSSLEEFVQHYFVIMSALRTERDYKAAVMFQKVKAHSFPQESPECK